MEDSNMDKSKNLAGIDLDAILAAPIEPNTPEQLALNEARRIALENGYAGENEEAELKRVERKKQDQRTIGDISAEIKKNLH